MSKDVYLATHKAIFLNKKDY